jgi:hypothetical protein
MRPLCTPGGSGSDLVKVTIWQRESRCWRSSARAALRHRLGSQFAKVLIFWGDHPRKSKLSGLPLQSAQRGRAGCHGVSGNDGGARCGLRCHHVIFARAHWAAPQSGTNRTAKWSQGVRSAPGAPECGLPRGTRAFRRPRESFHPMTYRQKYPLRRSRGWALGRYRPALPGRFPGQQSCTLPAISDQAVSSAAR